jgi:hypothetical protein
MIGNLFPGQGLGFTPSKYCCFGLGAMTVESVPAPPKLVYARGGDYPDDVQIFDNAYSRKKDEKDLIEFLAILFQVI